MNNVKNIINEYGGIIENVDGNNVTVSDGWQICGGYNSSIECMGFRSETYDISY